MTSMDRCLGLAAFVPNSAFRRTPEDSYLQTPKPSWYSKLLFADEHQFALDLHMEHRIAKPGVPLVLQDVCWALDLAVRNASLTSLNLSNCSLDASLLASLALVLQENNSIRIVDIRDNPLFSPEDLQNFMLCIILHNFTLSKLEFSLPKTNETFNTSISEELERYAGYIHARNLSIMSVRYPIHFSNTS